MRRAVEEVLSYDVGVDVFTGYSQWIPEKATEELLRDVDLFKMARLRIKERKWFKSHKALQAQFASKVD